MFRASLRSISDPVHHHVCFSCLARGFGAPQGLRQLHVQLALQNEVVNAPPEIRLEGAPNLDSIGDSSDVVQYLDSCATHDWELVTGKY